MPEYSAITYELADRGARITLNRSEAANSLNEALSSELLDAIIRSEENKEVRERRHQGSDQGFQRKAHAGI